MKADLTPLIVGALVFISSPISLKLGLSVAIIEIVLGAAAGNLGLNPKEWMVFIASAVLPIFVAQKWFHPIYSEDIIEDDALDAGADPA